MFILWVMGVEVKFFYVGSFVGKGGWSSGSHCDLSCGGLGVNPGVRGDLAPMVRGLRKLGLVYSLHDASK